MRAVIVLLAALSLTGCESLTGKYIDYSSSESFRESVENLFDKFKVPEDKRREYRLEAYRVYGDYDQIINDPADLEDYIKKLILEG